MDPELHGQGLDGCARRPPVDERCDIGCIEPALDLASGATARPHMRPDQQCRQQGDRPTEVVRGVRKPSLMVHSLSSDTQRSGAFAALVGFRVERWGRIRRDGRSLRSRLLLVEE